MYNTRKKILKYARILGWIMDNGYYYMRKRLNGHTDRMGEDR
jgi:hypothetical protein